MSYAPANRPKDMLLRSSVRKLTLNIHSRLDKNLQLKFKS